MLQMLWLIIIERNSLQEIMIMIITVPKISLVLGGMTTALLQVSMVFIVPGLHGMASLIYLNSQR